MKIFISGGCKNGKSTHAQKIARAICKPETPLYYFATMIPGDGEDIERIARHRQERYGGGFETVEAGRDIPVAAGKYDRRGTFLLDSVTALLANEMFPADGSVSFNAYRKITRDLTWLAGCVSNIVFVSDFIYSDACLYDSLTESYRSGLAYIDRQMADVCDVVLEACVGNYTVYKGADLYRKILCENA